jgi:hypothetical protein
MRWRVGRLGARSPRTWLREQATFDRIGGGEND